MAVYDVQATTPVIISGNDNLELNPASSQHSARDDIALSVRNVGKMHLPLRPAAGPLEASLSVGPEEALPRVLGPARCIV